MPNVKLPCLLLKKVKSPYEGRLDGDTVGQTLNKLVCCYPEIKQHLFDIDNKVLPFIAVFLNDKSIFDMEGLATPVGENDLINILSATAGG